MCWIFRQKSHPLERKTYFDIVGNSLVCSIKDDRGNIIVTEDVSKDFVAIGVDGDRVIFTNDKKIKFLPSSSEFKIPQSISFFGVKADGTPYVKTAPIENIRE